MKKRLFLTTGLISLINALTIIEQLGNKELYQDDLVIVSFSESLEFVENTKKIASLKGFNKRLFYNNEKFLFKYVNFNNYEDIYSVTFDKLYKHFKKHNSVYIFEEGPGFAKANLFALNNIKGIY